MSFLDHHVLVYDVFVNIVIDSVFLRVCFLSLFESIIDFQVNAVLNSS